MKCFSILTEYENYIFNFFNLHYSKISKSILNYSFGEDYSFILYNDLNNFKNEILRKDYKGSLYGIFPKHWN